MKKFNRKMNNIRKKKQKEEKVIGNVSNEKKIDFVTQFLEKYKVWFETIMCVTLSICAVIVSIQSNVIAQNQYMYEREKDTPFFVIDSYTDEKSQNIYVVDNTGGDVRQCYVNVNHYVWGDFGPDDKEVYLIAKDINNLQEEYLIGNKYLPFEFSFPTINNSLVSDEFNKEMESRGYEIRFYQFAVVTIRYTNVENEQVTDYYLVQEEGIEVLSIDRVSDLDYYLYGYFNVNDDEFKENMLNQIID